MNSLRKNWNLKQEHPLILKYKIPKELFNKFKLSLKLYISKALNVNFHEKDDFFLKVVEQKRNYRKCNSKRCCCSKREFNIEYNLVLKHWCEIISGMIGKKPSLLRYFRMTPNIRIKFGKD